MSLRAPLAVKVALAVAPRAGRLARAVLRAKALEARPGLQQACPSTEKCSLDNNRFDPGLRQHRGEKLLRHLALQQPVAVLGEGGGVPHRILDAQPDEPAEQQVVVDPLDQLPLRADRIERLQQQGAHQPLRRDRTPPDRRIQRRKLARQRCSAALAISPNQPQRMIRPNPLLQIYVAEKAAANLIVAAHRHPHPPLQGDTMRKIGNPFFSSLLDRLADSHSVPIVQLGGLSQWRRAAHAAWAFREVLDLDVAVFCLFDRDYRSDEEIAEFLTSASAEKSRLPRAGTQGD